MALTLHQESVPFTNKRVPQQISMNGVYTNPVLMSFAFDFTICTNILETVVYVRNDNANEYYRNVVVTLMKDDPAALTPTSAYGIIKKDEYLGQVIEIASRFIVPFEYSVEQPPIIPDSGIYLTGMYTTQSMPIVELYKSDGSVETTDENINVKFSYGYDELSSIEWDKRKSALIIPYLGNMTQPDTSYIPIRMRMSWKKASSLFTIRDYYIDISYERKEAIGVQM